MNFFKNRRAERVIFTCSALYLFKNESLEPCF